MGEALVDVVDEANDPEGEGQAGVASRRLHAGNQAQEVGCQDQHE